MLESDFWKILRDKKVIPGVYDRIENVACDGMPDVNGTFDGKDFWIELKVSKNKTLEEKPEKLLRPSQKIWHLTRLFVGARIFVLVRYKDMILGYKAGVTFDGVVDQAYYDNIIFLRKIKNQFQWSIIKERICQFM